MQNGGTLLLVLGLAGSGKSHMISALAKDYCVEENFACDEEQEKKSIEALAAKLSEGKYCVISERKYMATPARDDFLERVRGAAGDGFVTYLMCFENNLDAANQNCKHRSNKAYDPDGSAHVSLNDWDSAHYQIPEGAVVLKIHRIQPTPSTTAPPEIRVPDAP